MKVGSGLLESWSLCFIQDGSRLDSDRIISSLAWLEMAYVAKPNTMLLELGLVEWKIHLTLVQS
jgi:hypothetical protein